MRPIIQIIKRTYRTTKNVEICGERNEITDEILARIKEITVFGVHVKTTFSVDVNEEIVKIFGIPIRSSRRELWDKSLF